MKKMHVKIGRDGRTQLRVEGAVGAECVEFTRLVEAAVGTVERREYTAAYREAVVRAAEAVRERA